MQARKNREIAQLQRKIDEVPSRIEMAQYQRRFIELYNQGQGSGGSVLLCGVDAGVCVCVCVCV